MKKSIIKLMPIGGQAENGKSMYCLEIDDNWFIIDAGYRFPEVDKLGVDVIIPNFDYLKDKEFIREQSSETRNFDNQQTGITHQPPDEEEADEACEI